MSEDAPGFSVNVGTGDPLKVSGWAEINGLADDGQARALQDQVDHASMYRQCFSSNAGRYVLKDFMHAFLMADVVQPEDAPGSLTPGIRQGQANLVKHILYMIDFANTGGGLPTGPGATRED